MIQRDDMGWEVGGGSGLGTYVHPWQIHVNVWQNQYIIVKQNKVKIKKIKKFIFQVQKNIWTDWHFHAVLTMVSEMKNHSQPALFP